MLRLHKLHVLYIYNVIKLLKKMYEVMKHYERWPYSNDSIPSYGKEFLGLLFKTYKLEVQ